MGYIQPNNYLSPQGNQSSCSSINMIAITATTITATTINTDTVNSINGTVSNILNAGIISSSFIAADGAGFSITAGGLSSSILTGGTVSGGTFFSGSTPLNQLFDPAIVANGPMQILATQVKYLSGCSLPIPSTGLKVGSVIVQEFTIAKTAAGTQRIQVFLNIGTNGTSGDTNAITFNFPTPTAAADTGYCIVRSVIYSTGAGGTGYSTLTFTHNLSTTGLANIPCVCIGSPFTVNTTTSSLDFGLSISGATGSILTIPTQMAYSYNL